MINPFAEINWNPEEKDILSFGRAMLIGFSAIAVIFLIVNLFRLPLSQGLTVPIAIFFIGALLYIISNIGVGAAKPFYFIWFFLAATIGIVVSNILLMAFYYLFFSVFAFLFRSISGRDPLTLKKNSNKKSWWVEIQGEKTLKSYFKQF